MDVSRTHGGAIHEAEQVPRRTLDGQRVGGWVVAVVPVLAVLVGPELATEVVGCLTLGVLEVVLAVGGGLPDVDDGVGDGLLGLHVADDTVHQSNLSLVVGVLDDSLAIVAEGCVWRPEGAENGGGSRYFTRFGDDLVGDLIDETAAVISIKVHFRVVWDWKARPDLRFQTNDVADAMSLVPSGSRDLANGIDKVDTDHPLLWGELDFTSKVVDVLDERAEDDTSTLRRLGAHGLDDGGSEVRIESRFGGHFGGGCGGSVR